jgi:hypothetical protein
MSWASVDIQPTLKSSMSNKSKQVSGNYWSAERNVQLQYVVSSKSGLVGGGIKGMDRDHTDFTK